MTKGPYINCRGGVSSILSEPKEESSLELPGMRSPLEIFDDEDPTKLEQIANSAGNNPTEPIPAYRYFTGPGMNLQEFAYSITTISSIIYDKLRDLVRSAKDDIGLFWDVIRDSNDPSK